MSQQPDFLSVRKDYTDPDDGTGPVSPTLRAAALRAGRRAAEAAGLTLPTESEDAGIPPERWTPAALKRIAQDEAEIAVDAAIRAEIAADVRGDLQRDLADLRRQYPHHLDPFGTYYTPPAVVAHMQAQEPPPDAPRATYSPPAGVPDAQMPRPPTYCPSQRAVDPDDAAMWARLRAYADGGGRVHLRPRLEADTRGWRTEPASDTGDAVEASVRAADANWSRLHRVLTFAKWTIVIFAFCAAGAWSVACLFTRGG